MSQTLNRVLKVEKVEKSPLFYFIQEATEYSLASQSLTDRLSFSSTGL